MLLIIISYPLVTDAQERRYGNFNEKSSRNDIKGNITGKILDSKTNNPLEYASISITNIKSNLIKK